MTKLLRNTVDVCVYYNYRTEQADALFGAPEEAVQSIYRTHLDIGRTPIEAARLTLDRYIQRQEELRGE